ncbi:MAG: sulfatase-like hydrolase/transferase [Balneolaceae bacterium]|nr:sulfatase-like hydrolase/transferase [Balneolaceae bacterium]
MNLFLRKHSITSALFVIGLMFISPLQVFSQLSETEHSKPNILWISVEDISPLLGAYGDPIVQTPVTDSLAEEGMLFTNAFTTAGVCAPSRAAIITGMHQSSIGAHHMRTMHEGPGLPTPYLTVPPSHVKAFTEYLRAAGYYTTNNVKTDYQFAPFMDPRQPLTAWDESSPDAHWKNTPSGMPFFSVINLMTTHESRVWPHPDRPVTVDPDLVEVPPYFPDTPKVREDIARQYSNIQRQDAEIGEILKELDDAGISENTVVFFWSDHGGALPRQKRWVYDSGIHVPLIVRWPGEIEPGTINNELVSFIDLAPTVLSIAEVDVPAHMQGRVLFGPSKGEEPEYIFAARDRHDESYDMVRAVRDKEFKYIRNFYPNQPYVGWIEYRNRMQIMQEILELHADDSLNGAEKLWLQNTRPVHELYNINEDPHEINNLAGKAEYNKTLRKMSTELDNWMSKIGDMGLVPEDQLAEQFWPGGEQPVTNTPFFVVNSPEARETEYQYDGGEYTAPFTVRIVSTTHGASIAYTKDESDDPWWKLYTGPIRVSEAITIRAKAIRYGFAESDELIGSFTIKNSFEDK